MQGDLAVTGNDDADALLNTDPSHFFSGCFLTSACREEDLEIRRNRVSQGLDVLPTG